MGKYLQDRQGSTVPKHFFPQVWVEMKKLNISYFLLTHNLGSVVCRVSTPYLQHTEIPGTMGKIISPSERSMLLA